MLYPIRPFGKLLDILEATNKIGSVLSIAA